MNRRVTKAAARRPEPCLEPCPIERGMRVLGGKWKGSILWHLQDEPLRFNELGRRLEGASRKVLSAKLRELGEQGLVDRRVLDTRPVGVQYELTDFGRTALGVLESLKEWTESSEL
ncbi:MAG: helix-turn-helix domain-containing protein [Acidobacteriota bacterium]